MKKTASASKYPAPPKHLGTESATLWRSVVSDYDLESWQLTILCSACEALERMRQAQAAIQEHGIVVPREDGTIRANPAVQAERDSRTALYGHLKGLGLDIVPVSTKPGKR